MSVKYRPEVDGLRAIAVIAVVIYHAEFTLNGSILFPGGFIGVDVFFVISGYLIASIIQREFIQDKFSYKSFYERRVRRILPALYLVMICAAPFAFHYLSAKALFEYGGSTVSALLFGSNFWFWLEDSYTAESSLLKPFLHTWSLSVEEQFYLFFPVLFLYLLKKTLRFRVIVLLVLTIVSLMLAHYFAVRFPDAGFYLLPFRAWELAIGAILACLAPLAMQTSGGKLIASMLSITGLSLIVFSILTFMDGMLHPSLYTVIPVLGTALVLRYSEANNFAGKILSSKIAVGIGLISYSFYLWHYPIFAFSRVSIYDFTDTKKIVGIGAALGLAVISYYVVERPARNRSRWSLKIILVSLASVTLLLFFLSFLALKGFAPDPNSTSIANKVKPENATVTKALAYEDAVNASLVKLGIPEFLSIEGRRCHKRSPADACTVIRDPSAPTYILIGDSQARTFSRVIFDYAKAKNHNYIQFTQNGCLHVPLTIRLNPAGRPLLSCVERTYEVQKLLKLSAPSVIIYIGRLPLQLSGKEFDNQQGGREERSKNTPLLTVDNEMSKSGTTVSALIVSMIEEWLEIGHKVVVVYPIPEAGWHVPNHLRALGINIKQARDRNHDADMQLVTTGYPVYKKRAKQSRAILDSLGERRNLLRVYPDRALCSAATQRCYIYDQFGAYYTDDDHLSRRGVKIVFDQIIQALEN